MVALDRVTGGFSHETNVEAGRWTERGGAAGLTLGLLTAIGRRRGRIDLIARGLVGLGGGAIAGNWGSTLYSSTRGDR